MALGWVLGVRQGDDEVYSKYLRRINDARGRVDRVTPADLKPEERMDELCSSPHSPGCALATHFGSHPSLQHQGRRCQL